jgi:hypothetical protein
MQKLLDALVKERGAIVTSADCSEMELAFARSEDRFYVDDNGLGYVVRTSNWRRNAEEAIFFVQDFHRDEKATFYP